MGCEATSRPDVEPRRARGAFGSRRGEDPEGLLHGIGGSRCGCSGGTWAGRIPSPFSSSGLMRAAHRKGSASIHPASQNSSHLRKDPPPLHCNPGRRSASRTVASGLRFPSSLYVLFLRRRRALSTGKNSVMLTRRRLVQLPQNIQFFQTACILQRRHLQYRRAANEWSM